MKKGKPRSRAPRKKTPGKPVLSNHPVHDLVERMRENVHSMLGTAGIPGLSLRSVQFSLGGNCPQGQHLEKICETQPDGSEVCTWKCVPN